MGKNQLLLWGDEGYSIPIASSRQPRQSKKVIQECKQCGKKMYLYPSQIRKFCSRDCSGKWRSINIRGENSFSWKGGEIKIKCKNCGKFYSTPRCRKNIAKFCSNKCKYIHLRGRNHPSWKGGLRFWKKRDAASLRYKSWRNKIFKRDNWTCQLCGDRSKKKYPVILEVHHLKSWKNYPKLRYTLYNGITLCKECHLSNRGRKGEQ